jgi:hypothetical protein
LRRLLTMRVRDGRIRGLGMRTVAQAFPVPHAEERSSERVSKHAQPIGSTTIHMRSPCRISRL